MGNKVEWTLAIFYIVIVLAFVVWLFTIAWEFFLSVALIGAFVIACSWYFRRKYGNY